MLKSTLYKVDAFLKRVVLGRVEWRWRLDMGDSGVAEQLEIAEWLLKIAVYKYFTFKLKTYWQWNMPRTKKL